MFYELTTVTHHYAVDNKSIVEPLKSTQNLFDNMSQLFFAVWILNTRRWRLATPLRHKLPLQSTHNSYVEKVVLIRHINNPHEIGLKLVLHSLKGDVLQAVSVADNLDHHGRFVLIHSKASEIARSVRY